MLIYHSNDVHGRLEALAGLLRKWRVDEGAGLWFDSGDALCGSNTAFHWHEPILDFMSAHGCAAMAMGNREFHYWRRVLRRRSKQRSFPLLCANLSDLRCPANDDLAERSARKDALPEELALWQPYCELPAPEAGARSLGVLGATVVQYPVGSPWENIWRWRFFDPFEVLPPLAQRLYERGLAVIVLSHLGLDKDELLAALLPPGTLILGGHTHTVLSEPKRVGNCYIVQGGAYAQHLGRLNYDLERRELDDYRLLD